MPPTRRNQVLRNVLSIVAALVVVAASAATAQARTEQQQQPFRVVIVREIGDAQLARLAERGAVGLLVPGVGPTTNRRQALAALVRGTVQNARLGGVASGPQLIAADAVTGFPTGGPTIILTLPPRGKPILNDRRYRMAIVGGGYHGLLRSRTTRVPGVVAMVDVAPTALQRPGRLRWQAASNAAEVVQRLDGRITANNQLKLPALIAVLVLVGFLALLRPAAALPALPAALLGNLALGFAGPTSVALLVAVLVLSTAGGALLLERICNSEERMLALFAVVLVAYGVTLALDSTAVAVNPLGPTQNSRFFGIGNQLESLLLAPILAGAALAGRRYGIVGYLLLGAVGFVAVADNRLGADAGGAAVLAVGLAVLGSRLARLRPKGLLTALGAGAAGVLALFLFDQGRGGPNHMRSALSHGVGGLVDVAQNRLPLAYAPALHAWPFVGPFLLAFAVLAVLTLRGRHTPGRRDLILSIVTAVCVSLLVNDSAAYVLVAGITTLVAVQRSPFRFAPLRPLGLRSPATLVAPELATETVRD